MAEIVVVLPTYNEAGNIRQIVTELLDLRLDLDVLVVDDFSPDGTYAVVEEMAKADKRVHLLLRRENRGRGWAGIDGFRKALEMGARYVVEMDADFSHPPRYITGFLGRFPGPDIVVGSRYVSGGRDEARSFTRRAISGMARRYLSFVLGVNLADPTSGYRMFDRAALEKILPHLTARDPFIVTEVLYYARRYRMQIVEAPIEFMPRKTGESKLKASTLLKYLGRVLKLKATGRG